MVSQLNAPSWQQVGNRVGKEEIGFFKEGMQRKIIQGSQLADILKQGTDLKV